MIHLKGCWFTDLIRPGTLLPRAGIILKSKARRQSIVDPSIILRNLANPHPSDGRQGVHNAFCKAHLALDLRSRQHLLIPQCNHLTNGAQIKEAPALSPLPGARELLFRFCCQSIPCFQDAEGRVLRWIGEDVLTLWRGRVVRLRSGSLRRAGG